MSTAAVRSKVVVMLLLVRCFVVAPIVCRFFVLSPCFAMQYSKSCLKRPLKKDKTKVLMENGSLMKVESFAECSKGSILKYL